jgi:hypothetical protein
LTLCAEPRVRLLSLPYVAAVSSALSCFVSMTNKMASLVGTMYDPKTKMMMAMMLAQLVGHGMWPPGETSDWEAVMVRKAVRRAIGILRLLLKWTDLVILGSLSEHVPVP